MHSSVSGENQKTYCHTSDATISYVELSSCNTPSPIMRTDFQAVQQWTVQTHPVSIFMGCHAPQLSNWLEILTSCVDGRSVSQGRRRQISNSRVFSSILLIEYPTPPSGIFIYGFWQSHSPFIHIFLSSVFIPSSAHCIPK